MSELYHFNQNHDPRNGRFTFGSGDSPYGGFRLGRRSRRQDRITKREIKAAAKQRKIESREYRNISDEELQKRVNRLRLEKQYRDLVNEDIRSGKQFVADVLKQSTKAAATKATNSAIDMGFKYLNKKAGLGDGNDNSDGGNKKKKNKNK